MKGPGLGRTALVAGFGLLIMAVLAAASNFGVIEPNRNDLPAFAAGNPTAFGLTILALLVVAALDMVVALALWRLFSAGQHALAQLTAWFRLAYAAVFMVATGRLLAKLHCSPGCWCRPVGGTVRQWPNSSLLTEYGNTCVAADCLQCGP